MVRVASRDLVRCSCTILKGSPVKFLRKGDEFEKSLSCKYFLFKSLSSADCFKISERLGVLKLDTILS